MLRNNKFKKINSVTIQYFFFFINKIIIFTEGRKLITLVLNLTYSTTDRCNFQCQCFLRLDVYMCYNSAFYVAY